MHQARKNSSTMKNHSNTVPQKENSNSPETKLTVIKYYNLTDKEFKMAVMKKLRKLQEKSAPTSSLKRRGGGEALLFSSLHSSPATTF